MILSYGGMIAKQGRRRPLVAGCCWGVYVVGGGEGGVLVLMARGFYRPIYLFFFFFPFFIYSLFKGLMGSPSSVRVNIVHTPV